MINMNMAQSGSGSYPVRRGAHSGEYRGVWKGRGSWRGKSNRGRGGGWQGGSTYQNNKPPLKENNVASQSYYSHHGSRNPPMRQSTLGTSSPYMGWALYFPNEPYLEASSTVNMLHVFEKYFLAYKTIYNREAIERKQSFEVDLKELLGNKDVLEALPNLGENIRNDPEVVLGCLGLAMHQMLTVEAEQHIERQRKDMLMERQQKEQRAEREPEAMLADERPAGDPGVPTPQPIPVVRARLTKFEPATALRNLRASSCGKLVSVRGTLVRVGNVKPLCRSMAFSCNACGAEQTLALPDGRYALPTRCADDDCRGRSFTPLRGSRRTTMIDWQMVRLQEVLGGGQAEAGRVPRTVECELTDDLVDTCAPGDTVTVCGVVKVANAESGGGGAAAGRDKCTFLLYVRANSVMSERCGRAEGGGGVAMEFSLRELYGVREIQAEPQLFRLVVNSLCPAIYGHEMVKAGLVLGLFGGTQKYVDDKNRIPVRGDPHILTVGDPGLGKSQMLQAVASAAPRGVYVCGNTTTTSGLTVTLCKEGASGDYALEAGALVLADQGCCCIDEFDKMASQHQALLEAMEQQSISIAKAGVVCSLPARTSIIAAANPVGGHYNKAKTVSENLKMNGALLSRFDLVFILMDKPDEDLDCKLSEHVMALHGGKKRVKIEPQTPTTSQATEMDESRLLWEAEKPLSESLKYQVREKCDPIPVQLLRKYIGYARKYVHPTISPDAAKVLQEFYLELRRRHQSHDTTPITTRQLESLIRLTEARARLELREVADAHDAADVIAIMKHSMHATFSDELGCLDFRRSQHGSGMSERAPAKRMVAALTSVAERTCNSMFTVQQMREIAAESGVRVRNFEDFVAALNNQGFLLKKGPRAYQLQTTGF
ncbi:PREDICTED: DNA helicase MCM8-like isoform X2 [Priapulus caudatus]|nr:PREDICTED: DNA helicase MCM8-like isoform X2 [Priapulus caudatus]